MDCRDAMLSEDGHARARSDSLFCTPPPDDVAALNLLFAVELPQVWPENDSGAVIGTIETECSNSASQLNSCSSSNTKPERPRHSLSSGVVGYSPHRAREEDRSHTAHYHDQQVMASRGDSLTTLHNADSASAPTASYHLTAGCSTRCHPPSAPSVPTSFSSASARLNSNVTSAGSSAVRLIDYSSSEEGAETRKGRASARTRTKTRGKQGPKKYKSAEFVDRESDGSDVDTSDYLQQPRKVSPQTPKMTATPKNTTSSISHTKMRMDDYSWGASSSSKKRPLPPTPYSAATKRPKQSAFVVESGSEDESVSDDDDGYNFDKHIAATPEQPPRSSVTEDRSHYVSDQECRALPMSLETPMLRQGSARASENQFSTSKTPASQSLKLNKDRLLTLMAKKQGGSGLLQTSSVTPKMANSAVPGKDVGPLSATTRTLSLTPSAKTDLRNRSQSAARANSNQEDAPKSYPHPTTSISSKSASAKHSVQGRPASSSVRLLQEHSALPQAPRLSKPDGTQKRMQQTPSSAFPSTTARKAHASHSQTAANSSSLRGLLNTQKTAHRGSVQKPESIGSEWRRAQTERASSVAPAKDTHRPGVGSRYGHTLGARQNSSQEKASESLRRAPATKGGNTAQSAGSKSHAAPPAVTQVPASAAASTPRGARGRVGQSMQANNSTAHSTSNSAPIVRKSARDLHQPGNDAKLAKSSARQTPNLSAFDKKTKTAQDAPTQRTREAPRGETAKEMKQRPVILPSTTSLSRKHDEAAMQGVASSTVDDTISEQAVLSPSSTAPSRHNPPLKVTQHTDTSPHTTDKASNPVSPRVSPSQQAVAEPSPVPVHSSRGSNTGDDNGLNTQAPLKMAAAAPSTQPQAQAIMGVDKEVLRASETINSPSNDHLVRAPDMYASSIASAGPRMPVAIMVRPETVIPQSPRAQGTEKASTSPNHVVGTDTSQTADVSRINECQIPSSDKATIDTDTEQATNALLTSNRTQEVAVPEATELMDVSPNSQEAVTLDQGTASRVESAVDDAVSEHASGKSSKAVEQVETHNETASGFPSTPGTLPPASTTRSDPELPLLGANAAQIPLKLRTTIAPQSFSSKILPPQPLAAVVNPNDAEEPSIGHPVPTAAVQSSTTSSSPEIALPSPTISPAAEPYFEYTIHQTVFLSSSSPTTTELSAQPFTALDHANAQTDKLFQSAREQYELVGMRCKSTTSRVLVNGLSVHEATLISIDDPSKTVTVKLWVERAEVSLYANHTPSLTPTAPLIGKTLYALRLWRLAERADSESDSEAEDDSDNDNEDGGHEEKEQIRIYHPLPHICTEVHTSLDSANRAAKRVQIELSHEKAPKSLQAQWQLDDLRDLNKKLEDLRSEAAEKDDGESETPSSFEYEQNRRRGCWKSKFRGVGHDGVEFELLVTSVGVSGPRNI